MRILDACRAGSLKILSNVNLVCEGYDAEIVKTILLLRPFTNCSARVTLAQMIGRALRLCLGYRYAVIIDLVDGCKSGRRVDVNPLRAFGFGARDLETVSTDGRFVSAIADEIDVRKAEKIESSIKSRIALPDLRQYFARQISDDVETFDPIELSEQLSGLHTLTAGGFQCIPLAKGEDNKPQVLVVEKTADIYLAKIYSDEITFCSAGQTAEEAIATSRWKLEQQDPKILEFAKPDARWRTGGGDITDNQRQHLARLCGLDYGDIDGSITKSNASDYITVMSAMKAKKRLDGARQ